VPSNKIFRRKKSDEKKGGGMDDGRVGGGMSNGGDSYKKGPEKDAFRKNLEDLIGVHCKPEYANEINFEKMF
jgi:hypothetical protein